MTSSSGLTIRKLKRPIALMVAHAAACTPSSASSRTAATSAANGAARTPVARKEANVSSLRLTVQSECKLQATVAKSRRSSTSLHPTPATSKALRALLLTNSFECESNLANWPLAKHNIDNVANSCSKDGRASVLAVPAACLQALVCSPASSNTACKPRATAQSTSSVRHSSSRSISHTVRQRSSQVATQGHCIASQTSLAEMWTQGLRSAATHPSTSGRQSSTNKTLAKEIAPETNDTTESPPLNQKWKAATACGTSSSTTMYCFSGLE
mmetsp:Transcript_128992/g.412369  ORF Transcript_128992/g.412369 Transcript_128992/m.412369 type:complete len:270 (-) Transcript_128992:263-1072(-)